MGIVMTQKQVETKARDIAGRVFADGTMRTMLYELIVEAFGAPLVTDRAQGVDCPECENNVPHRHG